MTMRPCQCQGQAVVDHTVGCAGMWQRRRACRQNPNARPILQDSLEWDVALGALLGTHKHEYKTRPVHLAAKASMQVYVEPRPVRRSAGGDKWRNSGGRRGGTDHWVNEHLGLRKRYGRVVRKGGRPPLKFMRFALLHRQEHGGEVIEDRTAALYTVEGTVDEPELTIEQLQSSLASATTSSGSSPFIDLASLQFAPNVVQASGTYTLHEPKSEGRHLSSVDNVETIGMAQLQSMSTVAAIQEQCRMIGQLQHMVQEHHRIISTLIK
jgi:hypothetical protein